MKNITYIGIDPSICNTGVCVRRGKKWIWFTAKTKPSIPRYFRYLHIMDLIDKWISTIGGPFVVGIEGYAYGITKSKSVSILYEIGAIIRWYFINHPSIVKIYEFPPLTVKRFATGKSNASKKQMIKRMHSFLKPKSVKLNEHEADATAICLLTKACNKQPEKKLSFIQIDLIKTIDKNIENYLIYDVGKEGK